jgi:hypothetical protein
MAIPIPAQVFIPLLWVFCLMLLYWIIRVAVAHGMRDAWNWRANNEWRNKNLRTRHTSTEP